MAIIKRLTKREIDALGPGFHSDGANLYLHVRPASDVQRQAGLKAGSRAWVFQYKRGTGKEAKLRNIGLGSTAHRSLAQAREVAARMRTALADGADPASVLRARGDNEARNFRDYAAELIETKKIGFKSEKHCKQWFATLDRYAYPVIGNKRPRDITLADVKSILSPIWATKTVTASRLRQRIEAVLDYAAVDEVAIGRPNPARWKSSLALAGFQAPRKVAVPVHHPALQHDRVPALMTELRKKTCNSAYCLRWTILTAARSGESRGCTWSEINESEKLWLIPAARMKAKREHKVPLCDEALQIVAEMKARKLENCDFVFPGARGGLISDVAINKILHGIEPTVSVHGFRSSFRQWGAEKTSFASQVLELALAHTDPNKMQATYQRSDLFDLRRRLAKAWSNYIAEKPDNVLRFVRTG